MIVAPVKWFVRSLAILPDALRPGVFLAVVVALVWLSFVRRGIANAWHATCRAVAWLIYILLGLALLPEYIATRSRRRRGARPWQVAVAAGDLTDCVRDSAAALYERHDPPAFASRRPPLRTLAVIVGGCTLLWVVMDQLPVTSEIKYQLADAFQRWRDVEIWADVDPRRRAAGGTPRQPLPKIVAASRNGDAAVVALRCSKPTPCVGRLVVTNRAGDEVYSAFVVVRAHRSTKPRFTLITHTRGRIQVDVKRP